MSRCTSAAVTVIVYIARKLASDVRISDDLDGGSKANEARHLDSRDQSGPNIGLNRFLGLRLPWTSHPCLSWSLVSEVTLLAVCSNYDPSGCRAM